MMKRARRMSAKIKTREWDVTEYLRDEEDIRLYIEAAMEERCRLYVAGARRRGPCSQCGGVSAYDRHCA
jgi:DNA-binding phage protein